MLLCRQSTAQLYGELGSHTMGSKEGVHALHTHGTIYGMMFSLLWRNTQEDGALLHNIDALLSTPNQHQLKAATALAPFECCDITNPVSYNNVPTSYSRPLSQLPQPRLSLPACSPATLSSIISKAGSVYAHHHAVAYISKTGWH